MTEAKGGTGKYIIIGGAGFIGSHFTDRLLDGGAAEAVTVFDNFSSGREWHIERHLSDPRLTIVNADAGDADALADAVAGAVAGGGTVIHLAANPDIARAAIEPAIDFDQGTVLTHNVLEAMRQSAGGRILYASGSGVYGDLGETEADEETGPMQPVSTYGASKLASEAMIAAYCHLFGLTARVFRFGNVVGPRQTHGVGLDFIAKLRHDPGRLEILGDGRQSKPYIHVDAVIDAVLLADDKAETAFAVFNAAPGDAVTVTVRDEFNLVAYNGNDGTQNWTSAWQESGESDGPTSGKLQVVSDSHCATGNCLRVGGGGSGPPTAVSREVDLSGATSATLTFSYRRSEDTNGGNIKLQVSDNGGSSWTTLQTYSMNTSDA
ncbi:MAG: NAD-dependent epimerase/dehydratase family protein, partial [Proteobacteria bacterium]|nr:NAD-dependent epimerase/dehydratase family protein [Pseudomonadota bacterium]